MSVTLPASTRLLPAAPRDAGEPQARAVAALLRCIARYGLAKTTLDDVAREAGCSRATLYRWVESKPELLRLAVATEEARVLSLVLDAVDRRASLDDAVVAAVTTAARELRDHRALQFLLAHEPATVHGALGFAAGEAFTARVATAVAPAFTRWMTTDDATRAADWLVRVARSYCLQPSSPPAPAIDLADEADARPFLEQFVIPGLARLQRAPIAEESP